MPEIFYVTFFAINKMQKLYLKLRQNFPSVALHPILTGAVQNLIFRNSCSSKQKLVCNRHTRYIKMSLEET